MDNTKHYKSLFLQLKEGPSAEKLSSTVDELVKLTKEITITENEDKFKKYYECFIEKEKITNTCAYAFSRLIGGICSTGSEYRKGFSLYLTRLLSDLKSNINFSVLLDLTLVESSFKKTEIPGIKNAMSTGRICVFSSIISSSLNEIPSEILSKILNNIIASLDVNQAAESDIIQFFKLLLESLVNDKSNKVNKKTQKTIEDSLESWLSRENKNFLFHISILILIHSTILKFKLETNKPLIVSFLVNFIKNKQKYALENSLFNQKELSSYFIKIIDNQRNHISLVLIIDFLKIAFNVNENSYLALTWNSITDSKLATELISKSNKNYQFLLTKLSLSVLDIVKDDLKILSIFDYNYFKTFIGFEGGKDKQSNINQIVNSLNNRLLNSKVCSDVENYSFSLLDLYIKMSFSCITQKGLFLTLFKSISIKQKSEFIDKVINIRINKQESPLEIEDEEDGLEREDLKDALYAQVNILKSLVSLKSILPENSQIKMLNFILMEYFSNRNNAFQEVINYLEDKLVLFYWSLNATTQIEKSDEDEVEKSDKGLIKGILKFNKHLNTLIKNKEISIEEEDYKVFKKSLIDINNKIKEKHTFKNDKKKAFNDAIIKILLIVQVLYLRNPSDLNDTLFDLSELLNKTLSKEKLDDKFDTVFTEICLQLISLGSHMLSDYILKIFRKVSTYLERNSVDVLVSFIKS